VSPAAKPSTCSPTLSTTLHALQRRECRPGPGGE
jgi:hypothetical protein